MFEVAVMDQLLFDIFFWGVFVGGGSIFVIFCIIMGIKQYKRDKEKQIDAKHNSELAPTEIEYLPIEMRATVVNQTCCVKTIGIKTPKTIKEFVVAFQTENGEILKLNVPEEMYNGFEQGQAGTLTVVDGQLYGFELTDDATS